MLAERDRAKSAYDAATAALEAAQEEVQRTLDAAYDAREDNADRLVFAAAWDAYRAAMRNRENAWYACENAKQTYENTVSPPGTVVV